MRQIVDYQIRLGLVPFARQRFSTVDTARGIATDIIIGVVCIIIVIAIYDVANSSADGADRTAVAGVVVIAVVVASRRDWADGASASATVRLLGVHRQATSSHCVVYGF